MMQKTPRRLPCQHTRPADGCAFCRLTLADPRYAALFGMDATTATTPTVGRFLPPPSPPDRTAAPCVHLGGPTGEMVACPSCTGRVQLKTFGCELHQRCTVGKAAPGVACCTTCPDFTLSPGEILPTPSGRTFPIRDCLYHVYPLPAGGRIWRRGLGMLLARAGLFTGRRVVACMTGPGLESPGEVRRLAEPHGFEVIEVANDPALRETKTLLELLPTFETADPDRALFFGHAKAVTRPDNAGVSCHPWSILCHEVSLDYWPLVESQLGRWPLTGPFRKLGRGFVGSASTWHYSGSFAWFRSRELFAGRDWRRIDRRWWGAEAAPGLWYKPEEAGCLFWPGSQANLDLYRMELVKEILVAYALWRVEHEGMRTTERMVRA